MVVTTSWMESTTVVAISLCALCIAGITLIFCICWVYKNKHQKHHFYIIDQHGLRKIPSTEVMNNIISETPRSQIPMTVFNYLPSSNNIRRVFSSGPKKKCNSESDLIKSMELGNTFERTILCLDDNNKNSNLFKSTTSQEREDDLRSCISDESKYTFYSTYRRISSSTVHSVISHTDLDDIN